MNERIELSSLSVGNKLCRAFWTVASLVLFRPFVTNIFAGWRRCVLRLFGAKMAKGANVYPSVKLWAPWNLVMEENSCLGPHAICYNQAPVTIGKGAVVSQYAYLCTAGHRTDGPNVASEGLVVAAINVGENAWIGTRAYIGMGVEIGAGAIVGATASVYKDVEPDAIVGGNPAKLIRKKNVFGC